MNANETLNQLLLERQGVLKTAAVIAAGISKPTLQKFTKDKQLTRVSHGIYLAPDAWADGFYLLQARWPQAVFSHEAALYLLDLADREPLRYTVTVKTGYNGTNLEKEDIKVYKIKKELYETGLTEAQTPAGHTVRAYNRERTICDMLRSRRNIEIQTFQTALKEYVQRKDKNLPQLMRYAKMFRVEKILRPYLEVLLP